MYFICSVPIQETSSIKYLGVTTDNKLSWTEHVNNTLHEALLRLDKLRASIREILKPCSRDVKLHSCS